MVLLGQKFGDLEDLKEAIKRYEKEKSVQFRISHSRSIESARKRGFRKSIKPELRYAEIVYKCINAGIHKSKSKGFRPNQMTYRQGCESRIVLKTSDDGQFIQVVDLKEEHNHEELNKVRVVSDEHPSKKVIVLEELPSNKVIIPEKQPTKKVIVPEKQPTKKVIVPEKLPIKKVITEAIDEKQSSNIQSIPPLRIGLKRSTSTRIMEECDSGYEDSPEIFKMRQSEHEIKMKLMRMDCRHRKQEHELKMQVLKAKLEYYRSLTNK